MLTHLVHTSIQDLYQMDTHNLVYLILIAIIYDLDQDQLGLVFLHNMNQTYLMVLT